MNYLKYFVVLSVVSLIPSLEVGVASSIEKPKKLVFSMITGAPEQRSVGELLMKAYAKIGISVEFLELPGRRALEFSNSGKTDGEVFRIWNIVKRYHNLHRVETPVLSFRGYAFSTKNLKIDSWDDLKPYRVGIIRGNVWAENKVQGRNIERFENLEALVERLLMGGVDIIIETKLSVEKEFRLLSPQTKIYRGKILTEFKVYHYLNQRHKHLADQVNAEIMKLIKSSVSVPNG